VKLEQSADTGTKRVTFDLALNVQTDFRHDSNLTFRSCHATGIATVFMGSDK